MKLKRSQRIMRSLKADVKNLAKIIQTDWELLTIPFSGKHSCVFLDQRYRSRDDIVIYRTVCITHAR